MRRTGWTFAIAVAAIFVAAVALPAVGGAMVAASSPDRASSHVFDAAGSPVMHDRAGLLVRGVAWSFAVATVATLLGWIPGRLVRDAPRFRVAILVALVAPLCLPAYLVSWCWWQSAPPGSPLGDWAIHHGVAAELRSAALALGLVCWSWPLVGLAVATIGRSERAAREAMRLDRGRRRDRALLAWFEDGRGLVVGWLVVAMAVFGNTTAFDLAQVKSFGFELRTLDARGASSADVLRAAWPAFVTTLAMVVGLAIAGSRVAGPALDSSAPARIRTPLTSHAFLAILVALSAVLPLALLFIRLGAVRRVGEFLTLYGRALTDTALVAGTVAALAAIVACGVLVMRVDRRRAVRAAADAMAAGWLVAAAVPAMVVVAAFQASFNRGVLRSIVYDQPWIVPLAQLSTLGVVAALVGRFAARRVDLGRLELLRLEDVGSLRGLAAALRPELVATAGSAAAITAALSLGEIVVTARLAPPGIETLASSVLNAIHYQRPETAMVATMVLIAAALVAASIAATIAVIGSAARAPSGRRASATVLFAVTLLSAGCSRSNETQPMPTERAFGAIGPGLGQFEYPRAIDVDEVNGDIYVIDKTGRVQRFGFDGKAQAQWPMPESAMGKPTGVTVARDGTVWVADTHYHRVIVFDRDGNELRRFGEYGVGPGQLTFPSDIAFGAGGDVYVSEFGGNDRIQVFDLDGTYRRELIGPGVFDRPQSMTPSRDGAEIFVADACHHRIVVVDSASGAVLRTFGKPGTAPGDTTYPYGLRLLDDGTLLVAEFGGNRVQRLSPDGASLGSWGGFGVEGGKLRWPWGVASKGSTIFALDSGNNRVQVFELP